MSKINKQLEEIFGSPMSVYMRKDALNDGVLLDITEQAKELGIIVPVAVTSALWDKYIDEAMFKRGTASRRASALVNDLMQKVCETKEVSNRVDFVSICTGRNGCLETKNREIVDFKALLHGGDDGEPVVTIMLPDED